MYNRYIPQADGSFLRSSVPESVAAAPPDNNPSAEKNAEKPSETISQPPQRHPVPNGRFRQNTMPPIPVQHRTARPEPVSGSIGGFLKGLIPESLDTEDLIVILLLLLMSGGSSKKPDLPLLTLGIYLFL